MATTAIGSGDLSLLRGEQYIDDLAIHITPLAVVQTATVTAIPALSPFVSLTVTWAGSTANVSPGQLVRITSGSTHKAWAVVRKTPGASTAYISTTPIGSAGAATRIERAIAVDDTLTVYTHRPLWGLYSRIAQKIFYKQWDVAYTNQNSQPPPVSNSGPWQVAKLLAGETTARFRLPRTGSNTSFALGSATISSRLWTLPTGVTLASGYALTDSVIEVDAEPGYHLVEQQVTDSLSKIHSSFVWLFVSDGTTGASLDERYPIDNLRLSQTRQGFELTFTMTGSSLKDVLYPGAGITLREWPIYGSSTLTEGVPIDTFVGYVSGVDIAHDGDIGTAEVTVLSPYEYAAMIVQPPQALREVTSPTRWTDCTSALSNPRGFLYYLCKWHTPAMLDMHDVDASFTTPRRQFGEFGGNTLRDNLNTVAEYIAGNLGSTADGKLTLKRMPPYMSTSDRNAVASVMTLLEQDVQPEIRYYKWFNQKFSDARSGAFAFGGSTPKAWHVGKRWYQGSGQATLPNFTVTTAEGVAKAKETVGHFMAEQNSDIAEIIFTMKANVDVIDPAEMLWITANISSDYDTFGDGFVNERMSPLRVEREWTLTDNGWMKTIKLAVQPETFGQPGEEIPIANAATYQLGGFSIADTLIFEPFQGGSLFGGVPVMIANDDNGKLGLTFNYFPSSPLWVDLSPFLNDETVHDWCLDYGSDYFANGGDPNSALGLYAVTSSGTTLNVWYFASLLSSPTATVLTTVTMADASCTSEARIECSETYPDLVIVAWHDRTGTRFVRSTDFGVTWSSMGRIGDAITDNDNDNAPLGLATFGQTQVTSAPDSSGDYGLYIATTASGSFSAVTGTERDVTPNPMIKLYGTASGYATTGATADSEVTETVTFDAGGFADYTINAGTNSAPYESAVGNPDDCAREDGSSGGDQTVDFNIDIELGSVVPVTSMSFDVWHLSRNSIFTYVNTEYRVNFYNGMTLVDFFTVWAWQAEREEWHNTTEIDLTGSEPTLPDATAINDWLSTSYPDGIDCDRINIDINNTNQVNLWDWRIDNIVITYGSAGTPAVLYHVTTLGGTSVWDDVSPVADQAPVRPHDLAIDLVDSDVLHAVADNAVWYRSTNQGTAWASQEAATAKRVFLTAGDIAAEGGVGEVKLRIDGTTFEDRTGNLDVAWGSVGTVKRIAAL